jgi:nucleoside-diphosphate kinase
MHDGELAERTFVAFKHDVLQRALLGEILTRFERRGLKLVGLKLVQPTRALVEEHYAEHRGRNFFDRACLFLASGPVVASVWEGRQAISAVRAMSGGSSEPHACERGTIRGDFGLHWRRNLVHTSDSPAAAQREVALWFGPEEVLSWESALAPWLYELPTSRTTWPEDE